MSRKMNWALLGVLVVAAIIASIVLSPDEEKEVTSMPDDGATLDVSIPPIDAAAPMVTETATFALG